jgi:hypothetical protein
MRSIGASKSLGTKHSNSLTSTNHKHRRLPLTTSALNPMRKSVRNADKFEKFEILKERFKVYRENVLKIGFDNIITNKSSRFMRSGEMLGSSCRDLHSSHLNLFYNNNNNNNNNLSHYSMLNLNELNSNSKKINFDLNCPCSFCVYCAQYQHMLTELAYLNNLEQDIKEIRNFLRETRKKLEAREHRTKLALDWKQAALVLDRTFFFIYLVITFVTIFLLFPKHHFVNKIPKILTSLTTTTRSSSSSSSSSSTTTTSPLSVQVTTTTITTSVLSTITQVLTDFTASTLGFENRRAEQQQNGFLFF